MPKSKTSRAPICPECEEPAKLHRNSAHIYKGVDYGPVWVCDRCGGRVGCHPGTVTALGLPAGPELRKARSLAHMAFDRLWRAKMKRDGVSQKAARGAGYRWLADRLGIDPKKCHVGAMDKATADRVVEICKPYHGENRSKQHDGRGCEVAGMP